MTDWYRKTSWMCLLVVGMTGELMAQDRQILPFEAPPATQETMGKKFTAPPGEPVGPVYVNEIELVNQKIDLTRAMSLACQHNPTLKQARLQVSAELAKSMQAGLYPNPTFTYIGEQIFVDAPGDKDSPGEFQGGKITQRFVTADKLKLSASKYAQRAHVSEHRSVAQQFRVCNDVRMHFYQTLASRSRLMLRMESLKTAEDQSLTVREMYNLGQVKRYDVHKANVQLQQARLQLQQSQHEMRRRLRELNAVIGIPLPLQNLEGKLTPEGEAFTNEFAEAHVLTQSPELSAARAKLRSDEITIQREKVEWIPDIVVSAGSGYNFEAKETVGLAEIQLEIPLYDRNQGTIAQAQSDYFRQCREIERIQQLLRHELAMTYEQYAMSYEHAVEYRDMIVPEMKAAYQELLISYKRDREEWPTVLQAHNDYVQVRLEQIHFEEEFRMNEILIMGYLLKGGLQAAPGAVPPGHIDAVPKPR
ncbi:TolC family protein [Polystyrenella longa]|nr:TolC family protein [Polystyrenella longa]